MIITIGRVSIDVNKIIYVSPNGNDDNDGITEDTPVKSLTKAKSLIVDNCAVLFMEGTHEFLNEFTTDPANMRFLSDDKKQTIFYSTDPLKTKIILKLTQITTYGRQHFINCGNANSKLINLNMECISTNSDNDVSGLLFGHSASIINCYIKANVQWSVFRLGHGGLKNPFINSVLCYNKSLGIVASSPAKSGFDNCILKDNMAIGESTVSEYCTIEPNLYNMGLNEILGKTWGEGNPEIIPSGIGLLYGPYSMWKPESYCFHDIESNKSFVFDGDIEKSFVINDTLDKGILYPNISDLSKDLPKIDKKINIMKIK